MLINVIGGGSPEIFNAIMFPESTAETKQWLYDQFHRDNSMLTDVGRQFLSTANEVYQRLNDPEIGRMARKLVRGIKGIAHPNTIVTFNTIEECQKAKPVMQRYIMSMPEIRRLYHRQLCDGFSDSYVDVEPGKVAWDHYDYRRVMQGIVEEVIYPSGEEGWKSTMTIEDLHEGDRELDVDEKFSILRTWDTIQDAINAKIDPTDIFNGKLEF